MTRLLYPDADEFPVPADLAARAAEAGIEIDLVDGHDPEELLARAPGAAGMFLYRARVDARLLDAMPDCRVLARVGTGYDLIDVDAARERGVVVTNVPDFCFEEISDYVVMHVLSFSRRLPLLMRSGRWLSASEIPTPRRLVDRTLGIVGFGRTGQRTAEKARAFGLDVRTWTRTKRPEALERTGATEASFDEVLAADFVSLHVPLTPDTKGLIDAAALARMHADAVLINVSRGAIVDTDALVEALATGRLGGAALDVVSPAPLPSDHPLWSLPNAVLTSHSAALSVEGMHAALATALADAEAVLSGRQPRHPVLRNQA